MRTWVQISSFCVIALSTAACNEAKKNDEPAADAGEVGDAAGPSMCGFGSVPIRASEACTACIGEKCCDEVNRCDENDECIALRKCKGDPLCQDDACLDQCAVDHVSGAADQNVLGSCISYECAEVCKSGPKCGTLIFEAESCQSCMEQHCCDENYAAAHSVEFWKHFICAQDCPDELCVSACDVTYREGLRLATSLNSCLSESCLAECGG